MSVTPGNPGFGFCPGKATWDPHLRQVYNALVITAETGAMYDSGGINDQPSWYIDLLGWFLPRYNDLRFYSRVRAVLGDSNSLPGRK